MSAVSYLWRFSVVLTVQLLLAAAVRSSSVSPWPAFGHDSGLSFAAPEDVGVYSFYSGSILPLPVTSIAPINVLIPASGIYISFPTLYTMVVYNRTTEATSVFSFPPIASTELIGFDSSSSLRMYYLCAQCTSPTVGAYSLLTKSYLWTIQPNSSQLSIAYNSFTDTIDLSYVEGTNPLALVPYLARYDGATGKLLWSRQTGAQGAPAEAMELSFPNGNLLTVTEGTGNFSCRNGQTGDMLWNSTALTGIPYVSVGEVMLLCNVPTGLAAINTSTGELLWNSSVTVKLACTIAPLFASILLDNSTSIPKYGFVAGCAVNSTREYILVLDAHRGTLLYTHAVTTQTGITSMVTISANVYYTSDKSVYKWNPSLRQSSSIWTAQFVLQSLMVDSDGSLVAAPSSGNATLISPHLH